MINNSAIQALREDTARLIAKFDEPEAQSSTIETNGGTATEISDEEYWKPYLPRLGDDYDHARG